MDKNDRDQSPPILRRWRGFTSASDADAYVRYVRDTGVAALRRTPGNRGVIELLRVTGDRAEHLVMSLWESEAAIRAFAGRDISRAVFYPDDDRFLVEKDNYVDHFTVVALEGWAPR